MACPSGALPLLGLALLAASCTGELTPSDGGRAERSGGDRGPPIDIRRPDRRVPDSTRRDTGRTDGALPDTAQADGTRGDGSTLCGGAVCTGVCCKDRCFTPCAGGETSHCAASGKLFCCGSDKPVFCDRADDGAGCYLPEVDCKTLTLCKGEWHGCKRGEDFHCGTVAPPTCCGEGYRAFCDRALDQGGGCWSDGTDCASIQQCGGEWRACPVGEQPHCGASGAFACCTTDRPQFCDGPSKLATCWAADVDCSSVRECGGELIACKKGEATNCCPGGVGLCCPTDYPCANQAIPACRSPMDPVCNQCTR